MGNEKTISAIVNAQEITLPLLCADKQSQIKRTILSSGEIIADYKMISVISISENSELWFAKHLPSNDARIMKVSARSENEEIVQLIRAIDNEHIAHIEYCDWFNGSWIEVYPFYRSGCLGAPLSEAIIQECVLPSLISALDSLHSEGIIHNDIKPTNIYWNDSKTGVILGDFGSATRAKAHAFSCTPGYAAPEVLLHDAVGRYSDWYSVGMTLGKLIDDGEPLINAETVEVAIYETEKGIICRKGSPQFQRLINGMIQVEPQKRLGPNAARKWCHGNSFGGEERNKGADRQRKATPTIKFEDPDWVAADIPSLLYGIESHWNYAVFLFEQGAFDRFLAHFDGKWVTTSQFYRKWNDRESALFKMTYDLTGGDYFIWRGYRFESLIEMEELWDFGVEEQSSIITFLQRGNALYYLTKLGASEEQLEFGKRLENMSHKHPAEACIQLFQALRGTDSFSWKDVDFWEIEDIVGWLQENIDSIDTEVDELLKSNRFDAWLAFHGLDNMLDRIRRKIKNE